MGSVIALGLLKERHDRRERPVGQDAEYGQLVRVEVGEDEDPSAGHEERPDRGVDVDGVRRPRVEGRSSDAAAWGAALLVLLPAMRRRRAVRARIRAPRRLSASPGP